MDMKKLLILVCAVVCLQAAIAQPFEGTITWNAKQTPAAPAGGGAPGSLVLKVKGTSIITLINGGMMNGAEMWFMNHDTKIMRVMRPQKMFVVVPEEAMAAAAKASEVTAIVKTSETIKILGYTCTKYVGEMKAMGVTSKVAFWTTTEIKDEQKVLAHQPDPFGNPRLPQGVEGVPLKIEKVAPGGTTTLEVSDIKFEKLSDDLFKVPADFKEMGK
jgi:hypothetical protein